MTAPADLLAGTRWAILPEALDQIVAVVDRRAGDIDRAAAIAVERRAALAQLGTPLPGARAVVTRGNVSIVNVVGPMFRRANMLTDVSGATSTEHLAQDFAAAMLDPETSAVVLNIDSPGGEANGIAELAALIRASAGRKRIVSYAGDTMTSAALWIGAAASEIVLSPTPVIGSIGACAIATDTVMRDAQQGVRRIIVRSSTTPLKAYGADSRIGQNQLQATVDALTETFIHDLARFRGVSTDRVINDFGRGGLVPRAEDAIRVGLADRISTLADLLAELGAGHPRSGRQTTSSAPALATETTGVPIMAASDGEAIERRGRAEWDRDPALRAEFGGNLTAYLAYLRADAAGLVRTVRAPVVRSGNH